MRLPCARCCTGQRSRGRPFSGGHGPGDAFSTRHLWWLHQVKNKAYLMWKRNEDFSGFILNNNKFWLFLYSLAVSLPCSGSVMLTREHTVLQRDSTPSLVHYTHLWWGFITLVHFFIQIPYLIIKTFTSFSIFSFSQEAHVQFFSFIQRTQNRWYIINGGSKVRFSF